MLGKLIAAAIAALGAVTVGCAQTAPPSAPSPGWQLVVLGVAQDGGLPHLGCVRPRCEAARGGERPRERVVCVGITDGERAYLFDATPDFPAQVHALGARRPDGVFLTHAHIGHYTGLIHLGKEVLGGKDVPVYATGRMQHFLRSNGPWSRLVDDGNIELRDNATVDLGGVRVTAFQVPHRDEFSDTVGYRIEGPRATALYLPDIDRWELWDQDVRTVVESVDHAFLDATFASLDELPHRDITKVRHPLATESMDLLEGLGGRVWFVHLNHSNPLWDDDSPVRSRGFHIAREGDRFDL